MAVMTLLDIAKMNGNDALTGLVEETTKVTPEISRGGARTIRGINYTTLVRVGLPTVGFRNANEGSTPDKSRYEKRLFETFIFNPRWECDVAVADAHEDGADRVIADEAFGMTEASMQHMASQFYYGTGNDAKGFAGLLAAYDATNMVVDAGGTTDNTASSVWAVKYGPKDVQWLWGLGGSLSMLPVAKQRVTDANGKPYTAYCQEIMARPGLQIMSVRCIGRIKKLTEDNGKGLTDARIAQLLAKFPAGIKPDVLYMTPRSLEQLRSSRTPTNATGAPAPMPTEAHGIPIEVTDSIKNTEALAL